MRHAAKFWQWCTAFTATLLLLLSSGWCQDSSQAIPALEPTERVTDLWGNEVQLYFDLPDNILTFSDAERGVHGRVILGAQERNELMLAYLQASNVATALQSEGHKNTEIRTSLRGTDVTFKVARRDRRNWVVLYVDDGKGAQARFAIPQTWELKDPKLRELMVIKQGFEQLLLKSAL